MQRRNIVFIHIESFDGRQLGFWGDPALKNVTPSLDAIAREGVCFSNSYTSHPICCPARANLWSGTYSFRHESWCNFKGLEPGTRRFQDVLEQEGYVFASKQGGIGKHDYLSGHHSIKGRIGDWTGPLNIKLPFWGGGSAKVTNLIFTDKTNGMDWRSLRRAKKFLKTQVQKGAGKQNNPFFLYFSLVLPHPPYMTSESRFKKINIDAISIPKAENYCHPVIEYQKTLKNWKMGFDASTVKRARGVYYAMLSETDEIIGKLVQYMKDLKIYDDTYLIITADHGDNQLEHGQSLKSNMFESAAKVPLLIHGPDLEKGKICPIPVDTTDLFPTILDFAQIPKVNVKENYRLDFDLDGESLYPLCAAEVSQTAAEKERRKKDYAFSMYTGVGTNTSQFMLRQGDWKYWAFPGYDPLLFNLAQDPDEITDFSDQYPEIVAKMDTKMREIVDYEDVHHRHIEYCRQSLIQFEEQCERGEISFRKGKKLYLKQNFEDIFKLFYKSWTEEHTTLLRQFMSGK